MQLHALLYLLLLAGMFGYALLRGGAPERLVALGWTVAVLATILLPFDPQRAFHQVDIARAAVDVAVLLWFIAIACFANRFWPMWLAALHLIGVGFHAVKAYQPELLPSIYAVAVGKIGYPILLIMVVGVMRHQERLRRHGRYRDWSGGGQAR
jgi:hypothetical protein